MPQSCTSGRLSALCSSSDSAPAVDRVEGRRAADGQQSSVLAWLNLALEAHVPAPERTSPNAKGGSVAQEWSDLGRRSQTAPSPAAAARILASRAGEMPPRATTSWVDRMGPRWTTATNAFLNSR